MRWLVSTSLRLRLIVVILMCIFVFIGTRLCKLPRMMCFPEFAPPYVEIQVEAPGLSTAEVEALIAIPIENALNGTPYSSRLLRSKSVLGLASMYLILKKA